jgi:hypothetical protein
MVLAVAVAVVGVKPHCIWIPIRRLRLVLVWLAQQTAVRLSVNRHTLATSCWLWVEVVAAVGTISRTGLTLFVLETVVAQTGQVAQVQLRGLAVTLAALTAEPMTSIVQAVAVEAQVESEETAITLVVLTAVLAVLVVICLHGVANLLELPTMVVAAVVRHLAVLEHLARVVLVVAAMVRNRAQAVRLVLQTQAVVEVQSVKCRERWLVWLAVQESLS